MTTLIKDIKDIQEDPNDSIISIDESDIKDIHEYIMDGSIEVKKRVNVLNSYYIKFGESQTSEIVNRLSTMYQFSGTKDLNNFLYSISTKSNISLFLRIVTSKSLCSFNSTSTSYKALNTVCCSMIDEEPPSVATPCQIDAVCMLMTCSKYKNESLEYFSYIINNPSLECDYRYKTVLSLENKEIKKVKFFIRESMITFINNTKNMTRYRILSGQYLIQKCDIDTNVFNDVELILMSFAQDPDLDYNLRADSADVILLLGTDHSKETAREIIMMLGRDGGNQRTIFDNAQNVHVDEIEDSVIEGIKFLSTISDDCSKKKYTFEQVKKQVDEILEEQEPDEDCDVNDKKLYDDKVDKITISLNRILIDRALYSSYNYSLLNILLKIWGYIQTHDSKDEMIKRILEELVDMSGTCSTGYASRLINVISGFGDFNFRISYRDQLIANFTGRLNAKARDITKGKSPKEISRDFEFYDLGKLKEESDDESSDKEIPIKVEKTFTVKQKESILQDFQASVLEQMSINSNDFRSRTRFLRFFRSNMLSIREELYEEFKDHIDDPSFDLYMRSAIATYETGGYV